MAGPPEFEPGWISALEAGTYREMSQELIVVRDLALIEAFIDDGWAEAIVLEAGVELSLVELAYNFLVVLL